MQICGNLVFILREEHRLKVLDKRILRKIFGHDEEVVRGWRRLQDEELHNLYPSPNISRVIKSRSIIWAGHIAWMEEMRNGYSILGGKLEGKTPLGRPRRRR
jgi:hypothetical protein